MELKALLTVSDKGSYSVSSLLVNNEINNNQTDISNHFNTYFSQGTNLVFLLLHYTVWYLLSAEECSLALVFLK